MAKTWLDAVTEAVHERDALLARLAEVEARLTSLQSGTTTATVVAAKASKQSDLSSRESKLERVRLLLADGRRISNSDVSAALNISPDYARNIMGFAVKAGIADRESPGWYVEHKAGVPEAGMLLPAEERGELV